jgi:hypothetical protein
MQVQQDTHPDQIPVSGEDVAAFEKKDQTSIKRMAQFIWDQYQAGLAARRLHALAWIMVRSFLKGIHYFEIDYTGAYKPIPPETGKPRSVVPIIKPYRKHMLGFLLNNPFGFTGKALSGSSKAAYEANRAQDVLNGWIDDAGVERSRKQFFEILLEEGTVGLLPYVDKFRKNVFIRSIPGSSLFPIPHDARHPDELHGLILVEMMTKSWLELQDDLFEQQTGRPPVKRMEKKARQHMSGMHMNMPFMGSASSAGGKFNGSVVLTAWFRSSEKSPKGQYFFMVGNEAFRHIPPGHSVLDEVMPGGEIPVEIAYWDKDSSDFWAGGFCDSLIPAQLDLNRSATTLARNAKRNHPFLIYDTESINASHIQSEESGLIPMTQRHLEGTQRNPVYHFPATRVGRDVLHVIEMGRTNADVAAGARSGIVFGQQEGRTEGGPATTLLANNAFASLIPSQVEVDGAWTKTGKRVLDLLPFAWPKEKFLKLDKTGSVGRSLTVSRDQIPASQKVLIKARSLIAGGRNALLQILFQLTQMPGPDGKPGSELRPGEFRHSLAELEMIPPGLDISNRPAARIETRINLLIGDGQKPMIRPSEPGDVGDRLVMEEHKTALEMLKDTILDEAGWHAYGPMVKRALVQQARFHLSFLHGGSDQPNQFDDDMDNFEMQQTARHLELAEMDLETQEGEFNPEGEPLGAETFEG